MKKRTRLKKHTRLKRLTLSERENVDRKRSIHLMCLTKTCLKKRKARNRPVQKVAKLKQNPRH